MYIGNPHRNKPFVKHLIGYYPFDADFNDKIAPFVDLTAGGTGTITLSPAVLGNGAFCPAGTNSVLRNNASGDRHKYSFTNGGVDVPYSISFHAKIISVGASGGGGFWGKNLTNGSGQATNAEYLITTPLSDVTKIRFVKYSEGSNANYITYTIDAPPTNVWFWLLINDNGIGGVDIYVNNVLQLKTIQTNGAGFLKYGATTDSSVGIFNSLGVPSNARFIEGGIDDLGIFKNYVLTQEDRDWIWNGGNPRRLKNVS